MKAQVSLEFFIMAGFALIALISAVAINFQGETELSKLKSNSGAIDLCRTISSKINGVHLAGHGANTSLSLSRSINSKNYTAQIFAPSRLVLINISGQGIRCKILSSLITNGASQNFTLNHTLALRNENGQVIVS